LGVPGLWELVRAFKQECESQGWKTSQYEDWVHLGNEYHNLLWTRTIHPAAFKKITRAAKCAMRNGASYHVIDTAYTAWLFSEPPPEELWKTLMDDPDLAEKTAIYDLSCLHASKPVCLKYNLTKSKVFKQLEDFLRRKFGLEFKEPKDMITTEV